MEPLYRYNNERYMFITLMEPYVGYRCCSYQALVMSELTLCAVRYAIPFISEKVKGPPIEQ